VTQSLQAAGPAACRDSGSFHGLFEKRSYDRH